MRRYQQGEDLFNLIDTAIPEFARAEYPVFVDFLKLFLTYLERERTFTEQTVSSEYGTLVNNQVLTTDELGGTSYEIRKFLEYRDVDTTLDDLVPHFLQMFAKNFPRRTFISPQRFVDTLRYLYTHKSVEDCVTWFFRVLFNEHAAVYYPREDILKASDGTWIEETTIKVGAPTNGYENDQVAEHYLGQTIKTATGQAQVERVRTSITGQSYGQYLYVNELILKKSSIKGSFAPEQDVWNVDNTPEIHTTIIPVISGVIVRSGGENYVVGDIVTFSEGPGLGEGFGAAGIVTSVSKAPLNGIAVLAPGDGYVYGDPVVFVSSTGANAEAFVDQVSTGSLMLEGEADSGILTESQPTISERQYLGQEDRDYIPQDLSIALFLAADGGGGPNTLPIDAATYANANQGTWDMNTTMDYVLASVGSVPFMHPWCFGDATGNNSNVTLANTMLVVDMTCHDIFCANLANVFVLSSPTDTTTVYPADTSNVQVGESRFFGTIVSANTTEGLNRNRLFVTNTALENATFSIGQTVKCDRTPITGIGTVDVTTATSNVVGTGTNFASVLAANAHIVIGAVPYAVRSITNNTFLTLWTRPLANLSTQAWSIQPTGTIRSVTDQAQRTYGLIRHVAFISPGSGYLTPPVVTVDSISARAQALYHYDP